jgi:hypothetical protein
MPYLACRCPGDTALRRFDGYAACQFDLALVLPYYERCDACTAGMRDARELLADIPGST